MEASKTDQNGVTQAKLKVVKVVQLKRFLPKTDASLVFKRKISLSNVHRENVNIKNEVLDDSIVEADHKLNGTEKEKLSDVEGNTNSSKTVLTDNKKKCRIKFRSCSHTDEELKKLTEHDDDTLVKVGDTFESREAFRKHLNDNAKRWFYYYVCRTSKKNVLEYDCICMAYTLKPKDIIIRKQKKRTTACPCKIRLTVDKQTKKVNVYYVCDHHDHEVTEAAFYHYPHAKYLPEDLKDVFLDLAYLELDIDLIQKYIHSLVGVTIKRKDIASYAYKFKRKTFQRNLTAERRKYINGLIATIKNTYKKTVDVTIRRIPDEDCQILHVTTSKKPKLSERRKLKSNTKGQNSSLDTEVDADINCSEPVDKIPDNVFDSNGDLENYDVIVQYINEEGMLCDENGAPVTNSSSIMQFINNVKDEFLEEGIVLSDLVENVGDDIYPLDLDSVQERKPGIEMDVATKGASNVESTKDVDGSEANIEEVDGACEPRTAKKQPSTVVASNIIVNCDKGLSPTHESPAVYAEMDNFKKYYFVDHRYIKYEGENSNDKKQKLAMERIKRRERMAKWEEVHHKVEEYIKAPESIRYPSSLRHCSGHEALTLPSGPDVILPGAKFLTHEVFLKHINERASRWFFYYSLVESGKVPEFYVYKCVFGKHRTSKNAYRAKGIRKRSKLTTQCPCQIRLRRLYADPVYLTVLYSCNHHDHALDAQLFNAQPHSRRLPGRIKEDVKDLLSIGAKYDVLRKYVTAETGLRVYGKYFHNVRVKMARTNDGRKFTGERLAALTRKLKNLEAMYGSASKENPQCSLNWQEETLEKRRPSSRNNRDNSKSCQDYYNVATIDDVAEEVCIVQTDFSPTHAPRNHSRLEARLQNLLLTP